MLDDFNLTRAASAALKQSAALVFVNSDSGEGSGGDRYIRLT